MTFEVVTQRIVNELLLSNSIKVLFAIFLKRSVLKIEVPLVVLIVSTCLNVEVAVVSQ